VGYRGGPGEGRRPAKITRLRYARHEESLPLATRPRKGTRVSTSRPQVSPQDPPGVVQTAPADRTAPAWRPLGTRTPGERMSALIDPANLHIVQPRERRRAAGLGSPARCRNHERPDASTAPGQEAVTAGLGPRAPGAAVAVRWPHGRHGSSVATTISPVSEVGIAELQVPRFRLAVRESLCVRE
jgi:hypothetical protein